MSFPTALSVTPSVFDADTTSHLVAMPATPTLGNLLVCIFASHTILGVTTPAGWTRVAAASAVSTNHELDVYTKVSNGTEGGTTVDFVTGGLCNAVAQVYELSGALALEGAVVTGGASVNADPPSLSPSWGASSDTLWIAVAALNNRSSGANTPPANYGSMVYTETVVSVNRVNEFSATRALRAATEDPGTYTTAASQFWVAATLAVQGGPDVIGAAPTRPRTIFLDVPWRGMEAIRGWPAPLRDRALWGDTTLVAAAGAAITVDMELLSTATTGFDPSPADAFDLGLINAAIAGQAPTATETLTLALLAAAAAGQALSATETATLALLAAGANVQAPAATETAGMGLQGTAATPVAPTAAAAAGLGLQGTGATALAPGATEAAGMPLLSGGPGAQSPTPGAALSVPLQAIQLQLFEPTVMTPWVVDVPLLQTLAILLPVVPEIQLLPPISRGRARYTAPTEQARVVKVELLTLRLELKHPDARTWTVIEDAAIGARLEELEPEVRFTWPAAILQAEDDALLEEDLLGIGI